MISIKVSYTVKSDYVEQNKDNIAVFLSDFKKLNLNFLYNVYLQEDGLSFLHVAMYESEDVQQQVLNVPSFMHFQKERDEQGLVGNAKIETLNLIGSSLRMVM